MNENLINFLNKYFLSYQIQIDGFNFVRLNYNVLISDENYIIFNSHYNQNIQDFGILYQIDDRIILSTTTNYCIEKSDKIYISTKEYCFKESTLELGTYSKDDKNLNIYNENIKFSKKIIDTLKKYTEFIEHSLIKEKRPFLYNDTCGYADLNFIKYDILLNKKRD